MPPVTHTRWSNAVPASADDVLHAFRAEGLSPSHWSNGPGDRYSAHSHSYHKVLFCISGRITFILIDENDSVELRPGDRLDIPPNTTHAAVVGPEGVACAEAARH
jgi:quercetin dioxygenase-like cupin family protein